MLHPEPSTHPDELARLADLSECAWEGFLARYRPLLGDWCQRRLPGMSSEDLLGDILARLVEQLPRFRYEPGKRFRGWLRTVASHVIADHSRRAARRPQFRDLPADLPAPEQSEELAEKLAVGLRGDYESVRHLLAQELPSFGEQSRRVFWEVHALGRSCGDVAADLGMQKAAVHQAYYRILRHVSQRRPEGNGEQP